MANSIYNTLNGGNRQPNMLQQFQQFMSSMQGRNPNQILNELVSSGKVSQAQLDQAQRQAQQMQAMFEPLRAMFGK